MSGDVVDQRLVDDQGRVVTGRRRGRGPGGGQLVGKRLERDQLDGFFRAGDLEPFGEQILPDERPAEFVVVFAIGLVDHVGDLAVKLAPQPLLSLPPRLLLGRRLLLARFLPGDAGDHPF